jgi:hypothetical protein
MAKSLLYRLFGAGKIPAAFASELQTEGVVLMDEGLKASVTYLDFHQPGKYASWQRQWFAGSIALTKVRLLALRGQNPLINIPLTDARIHQLRYSLEGNETLCVAFDPALFHPDWSGTIEYRFKTELAGQLIQLLQSQ